MVDIARFFMEFVRKSLRQVRSLPRGTRRMLEILNNICGGKGKPAISNCWRRSRRNHRGCIVWSGQGCPSVLSTLKYFRDEYEAHIYEKKCRPRFARLDHL
jgi:NADH:ubiquinone oxidoreductase subunit F (NADH-binding)